MINRALLIALLLVQSWAFASDRAGTDEVKELLDLSGARQQYQQLLLLMTRSVQSSFSAGLAKALREQPTSPDRKKQAKAILDRHFSRFITQFQERVKQTLTWDRLVRDVYAPVYLRHFSQQELQDIIAFYRSPTGRKFASKSGELVKDASQRIKQQYGKQLNRQANELTEQTLTQIANELKALRQESRQ